MRLTCPNCGAQYDVDDKQIPRNGREVQCSNCGHGWFESGADRPMLTPAIAEPPKDAGSSADVGDADATREEALSSERGDARARARARVEQEAAEAGDPSVSQAAQAAVAAPLPKDVDTDMAAVIRALSAAEPGQDHASEADAPAQAEDAASDGAEAEGAELDADALPEAEAGRKDEALMANIVAATLQPSAGTARADRAVPGDADDHLGDPEEVDEEGPQPRRLKPSLEAMEILRAEARRERTARQAEAQADMSEQPELDMGTPEKPVRPAPAAPDELPSPPHDANPLAGSTEAERVAAAGALARRGRDLLPDIEEINSTLQPSGPDADGEVPSAPALGVERSGSGPSARVGFALVLFFAALAVLIYAQAPTLIETAPEVEPALSAYVDWVNGIRVWLDQGARSIVGAVVGSDT